MKSLKTLTTLLLLSAACLASAQTAPAAAGADKSKPEVAAIESVELQGVITEIDRKTRSVTIKGATGSSLTFVAGPQVKNFKQLKVGDIVNLNYSAALALDLRKGGGRLRERIESEEAATAKPGEMPAAGVRRTVKIIADVTAVDAAAGTLTLRGPKQSIDLVVKDKELLKDIRVGDQLAATYQEAVLVSVTPPPPPAPAPASAAPATPAQ